MLVDDNLDDNFFHEREIKKSGFATIIILKNSGTEALAYLRSMKANKDPYPDLIFLDINMPGMNGWEFLKEYRQLDKELQVPEVLIMLTTSDNPDDEARSKKWGIVSDYLTKPLTKEVMEAICAKYFDKQKMFLASQNGKEKN